MSADGVLALPVLYGGEVTATGRPLIKSWRAGVNGASHTVLDGHPDITKTQYHHRHVTLRVLLTGPRIHSGPVDYFNAACPGIKPHQPVMISGVSQKLKMTAAPKSKKTRFTATYASESSS